jgi:hypothetical protein
MSSVILEAKNSLPASSIYEGAKKNLLIEVSNFVSERQ